MRLRDLHVLPKFRDGWSYLYVEHCRIDQDQQAVALHDADGKVAVPCANLAVLMIGPGVSITHAAVKNLADHGCLVAWCGEEGIRFYALGLGETRSAANLLHQARLWASRRLRMQVVRRLYQMRFTEPLAPDLSLRRIRGLEGIRVRRCYEEAARATGVAWSGRNYRRDDWMRADPVNRALSTANSCLYGICHAAIVSAGFSPALGFIHTGTMLAFVYDVADLYKTEITIPLAFRAAAESDSGVERRVRLACRDRFRESRLLARIVPDIQRALGLAPSAEVEQSEIFDGEVPEPVHLWDPERGQVAGGRLWTDQLPEEEPSDDGDDS